VVVNACEAGCARARPGMLRRGAAGWRSPRAARSLTPPSNARAPVKAHRWCALRSDLTPLWHVQASVVPQASHVWTSLRPASTYPRFTLVSTTAPLFLAVDARQAEHCLTLCACREALRASRRGSAAASKRRAGCPLPTRRSLLRVWLVLCPLLPTCCCSLTTSVPTWLPDC